MIDVGNTRTKIGIVSSSFEISDVRIVTNENLATEEWLTDFFGCSVLVSSVKTDDYLEAFINQHFRVTYLSFGLNLNFTSNYTTPNTLGSDRIALLAAASELWPQNSCLLIDAGTCVTYDYLDEKSNHLGGNISPGINMRLQAMHHFTANLPLVSQTETNPRGIGTTTHEAIATGCVTGLVKEINSYVQSFISTEIIKVILTGGDASYLAKHIENLTFVEPNLVLLGLCKILKINAVIH